MRTVALASLAIAAACASTTTKTEWKSPDLASYSVGHVLVVALMPDEGKRRAVEDAMVKSLESKGVAAESSWQALPAEILDREAVRTLARAQGNDGVLVVRLAGQHEEIVASGAAFDPYWGYAYPLAYGGTYDTMRVVTLDSRLFAMDGKMIWAGSSETFDPQKLANAAKDIAGSVTGTLKDQGALAAGPAETGKG